MCLELWLLWCGCYCMPAEVQAICCFTGQISYGYALATANTWVTNILCTWGTFHFQAVCLYCCPDGLSWPANAIQMGGPTWVIWAAIKKYSLGCTIYWKFCGISCHKRKFVIHFTCPNCHLPRVVIKELGLWGDTGTRTGLVGNRPGPNTPPVMKKYW